MVSFDTRWPWGVRRPGENMIRIFVATAIVAAAIPVDPLMAQARLDAALADSLRGWVVNMGVRFHARDAEAMIAMYADSATVWSRLTPSWSVG